MSDVVINAQRVGKKFCRSLKRTMLYGAQDVARDMVSIPQTSDSLRADEFWALHNISFEMKRGECLGLIGANGAGKSTLLKLLTGVTLPDKGTIGIRGRVGALLELGAGFHPLLTGRENIHLSGAILGLCKQAIDRKFDEIVDFAALGDFIDTPVKHYSSGMYMRLGFAVAAHAEPDVLLIDESLAVGDARFQVKCFAKLREFQERGTTIIFVTHSLDLVTSHCNRALLLDKGTLIDDDAPKKVIDRYHRLTVTHDSEAQRRGEGVTQGLDQPSMLEEIEWNGLFDLNPHEDRYGTRKAEILEAGIFNPNDDPVRVLERNQEYVIKVKVRHNESMVAPIVAYTMKDPKGLVLCGTNTFFQKIHMGSMPTGAVVLVVFRQIVRLNPGEYLLSLGCGTWENGDYLIYDRRFDYIAFEVIGSEPRVGLFDPESVVEWRQLG